MITVKLEGVKEAMELFNPAKVRRAAQATLNRVAKSGKTEISSKIREDWKIKKKDLDPKITVKPKIYGDLSAALEVRGESINLLYFDAQEIRGGISKRLERKGKLSPETKYFTKPAKKGLAQGVIARIKHSRKTVLTRAFMGRGRGGTPLVFIRSKKVRSISGSKEGLRAIKIFTYKTMFKQSKVLNSVITKIKTQWQKEWDNQVKQLNSGKGWMEKD